MSVSEVIEQALELKTNERFRVVDEILKSLDKPDIEIDSIWADEAERRLSAFRQGKLATVSEEEFFSYKYDA
jgi:putative addiction module component (TIGR02574 family)